MFERFLTLVAADPDAVALIDAAVMTRADLLSRADEIASGLAGLHAGDIVAAQLPNSAAFVAAFLAALKLKLVFAPIDRDASAAEVETIVRTFGVRALLACG